MATPEDIKEWIEQNLADSKVEISGDGRHFDAVIVCSGFTGKTRIQRHQMVYAALGDKMKDDIHALSMQTMTPEDWAAETTSHQLT
jgi:acid stress-induced BolA-like protein IbaG/YrbA